MKVLVVRHTWGMGGLYDCSYEIVEGRSVKSVANKYNEKHGELGQPEETRHGEFGFCNGNEEIFLFMEFNQ